MSVLRGVRVLVVENDQMNAMLLDLQLVQAGAVVLGPVGEVAQALTLIKADAPEIAVLDYRLGNGETSEPVARLLSELGIPFVLATGVASGTIPGGFERGVILTKPYLSEELISALSRARQLSGAAS
ncbi:response regulator [Xanthomonas arboricola pv. juglandis]|jgi:CheY-like chemotaxis protein|uniref:Response regulator n=1 Tax=Xanthomonas euroxanthea TaxID=2259622 RepID=A0A6V7MX58_9XANT|nr:MULTISPECIES: response regulator [Xanthomonas]PPT32411.1 response regulator [Xanthomonas arboricola]SYZ52866.1 response regulator [Xanthomonas arboricola pv. juglandis]MBB3779762.1 CheY-like chemotaxis protein [Xanthomonas euroxanthea]MBB3814837.1 CheY-like chemotaxis protein [Xanthomonas euroxanthea]MBB5767693.1 CheY-like chemotaxis protein [Xanthomonas euroxanthea]